MPKIVWRPGRDHFNQYVILGAGLDSYALRHAAVLNELIVFEVDGPPMQDWKQARFTALGLDAPQQLRFAPCDFERTSIADALAVAGFEPKAPALISWLGVSQYLSPTSVSDTLRWAASCAPQSMVILTFVTPGPAAEAEKARFAAVDVKFESFFTPDQMTGVLRQAGFRRIEHFSPEQANSAYFLGRSDGLQAPTFERLVSATVG
jgi:methyltransferase (TIGR00027 family)